MTGQHAFKDILESDFFSLFNLPVTFDIDLPMLAEKYRDLQKKTHPDRFSVGLERERLLASQLAAHANDAYQTLKTDLPRAQYLLALKGIDWQNEQQSISDPVLLMEQMELHDELDSIRSDNNPIEKLTAFSLSLEQRVQSIRAAFSISLENDQLDLAKQKLQEWQFIRRILQQTDLLFEVLEDI